jgi:tRNA-Thr(GGU) m(6)t(6)A37 methyltransferase TsaA
VRCMAGSTAKVTATAGGTHMKNANIPEPMEMEPDKAEQPIAPIAPITPIAPIVPIGIIHSCFSEKFGIPRQPGMVKSSSATLEFFPPYNRQEMFRGLEQFSHIWVHFYFHKTASEGWRPTVRPPWLGGKKRLGLFATRSPHRPNHMGLSVVRLEGLEYVAKGVVLKLSGIDFLDKSPVLDIKPYIPYTDSIESAECGYARGEVAEVKVAFSEQAELFCDDYQRRTGRNLHALISEMIAQDPRPASQKGSRSVFGMSLWEVNVRWRVDGQNSFIITSCEALGESYL